MAEACQQANIEAELIFVDDGNEDNTAQRLAGLSLPIPSRVLSLPSNQGKGMAVATGFLSAAGAYCIFADADGAYAPESVLALYGALQAGSEVAIANRRLPELANSGEKSEKSSYLVQRQVVGNFFAGVTQFLLGLQFSDTQAGLKGFSQEAANYIFKRIHHRGFLFDLEVMIICQEAGFQVEEVPIKPNVTDDQSTVNMVRLAFSFVPDLIKIRNAARRGAYSIPNERIAEFMKQVRKH